MSDERKNVEEATLEEELYGDGNTSPNTFTQPSMGVQASIVARILEDVQGE